METLKNNDIGPFRTNRFDDRYLLKVNRERFDRLGADTIFSRQFGESLFEKDTFYIVIGTDSGLLPDYVVRQGVPDGTRYLFVELPEVIERIRPLLEEKANGERISYSTPEAWKDAAKALGDVDGYVFLNRLTAVSSCAAEDLFWPNYREVGGWLREDFHQFVWNRQSVLGTEVFTLKQFENFAENRTHASCLRGLFPGKTAVVLGAGPSLDDILPWIKDNRDNLAVIAVSRVSGRLQEVDIVPDVIVSVDPHPVSFDVSNEMLSFGDSAILVHAYHVLPALLGQWGGRNLYWGPLYPWEGFNYSNTPIIIGPTVTNMALDTAVDMGFSQIVLAGVDLCHSREGYSHAKGSHERKIGARIVNANCLQVETFGGWMAETSSAYASAAKTIGEQAQKAHLRGCRIINSAAGAAKVSNVVHVPLDEIVVEKLQAPISQAIKETLPEDSPITRCEHYRKVQDELGRVGDALSRIEKLSKDGLKANERLFRRGKGAMDFRQKARLDRIEKALEDDLSDVSRFVRKFGICDFIRMTRPDYDRELTAEELETVGRVYYLAYKENAEQLLEVIEDAQKRLSARLEEESSDPDVPVLADQWRKDKQPGRSLVWRSRHPDIYKGVSERYSEVLSSLEEEYKEQLDKGFVGVTSTMEVSTSALDVTLTGAFRKILSAYGSKDKESLNLLSKVLSEHSSEKAKPLYSLAKGYIAEMDGDHETAFEMFQELLEEEGQILEEGLRSIAFLCLRLDDHENALLALDRLSAISPVYLQVLGDTYRAIGDHPRALEVYADYLEEVPEDIAAMVNLGCYYNELGVEDGARLMFSHALELEPENQAVKQLLEELGSGTEAL